LWQHLSASSNISYDSNASFPYRFRRRWLFSAYGGYTDTELKHSDQLSTSSKTTRRIHETE